MIDVKKVVEEQKIWDKEKKATRSEKEVKKLVLEGFHRQIWIESK